MSGIEEAHLIFLPVARTAGDWESVNAKSLTPPLVKGFHSMQKKAGKTQIFYQNDKPVTFIDPEKSTSICRTADVALAENQAGGIKLLETDAMGSVLRVHEKD